MDSKVFETEIGGRKLIIETGKLAKQASGSVTIKYGDTVVLVTSVMSKSTRDGIDYLPLMVDYEERYYAAGKIKGSRFVKREGKPTDEAIVTARLIDRALRPLFDERIRNDIQVVCTVLSTDKENDPDVLSMVGASASLMISDIPWGGQIAACRVGKVVNADGTSEYVINPTYEQRQKGVLDLVIAATKEQIIMLEAEAKGVKEEDVIEAVEFSKDYLGKIIAFQKTVIDELKPVKTQPNMESINPEVEEYVKSVIKGRLEPVLFVEKVAQKKEIDAIEKELRSHFIDEKSVKQALRFIDNELQALFKEKILSEEKRPDGRALDEIRPISVEAGILPRVHGSSLFTRGQTQALCALTLGAPGDEQILESMELDEKKRFMLHYNFPAFSVGEVAPMRGPGRREIGHGFLAERTLESLIPPKEDFPYTIRLVVEILSSNGSSSMASVCSGSLALMDAGVPIKNPAAGVALGIVHNKETGEYKILTDIQGPEDHFGEMDFKVAGTVEGINAIQMDVKEMGINTEILRNALDRAKKNREFILNKMKEAITEPRKELSPFAPRIITLKINPEKIREVIGPGGKVINEIIDETGVKIDINDDGLVFITAEKAEAGEKALELVKNIVKEFKAGELFKGRVTRIMDFGAFVELIPGHEGLVHISELAPFRVERVEDIVKVGDIVPVKVREIDSQGRINLTMKETDFDFSKFKPQEGHRNPGGHHQPNHGNNKPPFKKFKQNDYF